MKVNFEREIIWFVLIKIYHHRLVYFEWYTCERRGLISGRTNTIIAFQPFALKTPRLLTIRSATLMKKTTRLRPTDSTSLHPFFSLSSPPSFRYKFNYRLKYAPSLLMRPINSARKPRILDSKETLRGRDNEPPFQLLPIRRVSKLLRKAAILF